MCIAVLLQVLLWVAHFVSFTTGFLLTGLLVERTVAVTAAVVNNPAATTNKYFFMAQYLTLSYYNKMVKPTIFLKP